MTILVTGGAGYIGSHTCIELINNGFDIIIMDNFYNSSPDVVDTIEKLTNTKVKLYPYDMMNPEQLEEIFSENAIDAVIHFAGLKAVGESVANPLLYYNVNIGGSVNLLKAMEKHNVRKIVFSSSATVYGDKNPSPYVEDMPLAAINPYGYTKLAIEHMITDLCQTDKAWKAVLLRYFNPVGAHESGLIGDNPNGIPNNLMPYIQKVAVGDLAYLNVFGNDYPTPDGTGYRDYLHVVDLAKGHVKALEKIDDFVGAEAINLGTGNATSVLELVKAFEKASGVEIPYKIMPRRGGDLPIYFADASLANEKLGWTAELSVEDMCKDAWNFIQKTRSKK